MEFEHPAITSTSCTKSSLLGWTMVICFVIFNVVGAFLLKKQILKIGNFSFFTIPLFFDFFSKMFFSLQTMIAIGSLSVSTVSWTVALANLDLSKAYPIGIGLYLLAILFTAAIFYGESFTFIKLFGVFLILCGIFFASK